MENVANKHQVRVNIALQVAGIAAQVVSAMKSGSDARRDELESKLTAAQNHLDPVDAPPGLVPFIDVMRGILRGENVAARAGGLPPTYRAVYDQVVDAVEAPEDEGELTVRQVLDEVTHNVITVLKFGSYDQQQQLIDVLEKMQRESDPRPHLSLLATFVQAARLLIQGDDPAPVAAKLDGVYRTKWEQIVNALDQDAQ